MVDLCGRCHCPGAHMLSADFGLKNLHPSAYGEDDSRTPAFLKT